MLLFEFIAVGSWGFWVLLSVAAIVMSEMLDTDHPGYATLVALVTVATISFFGNFNPFHWIRENPTDFGLYVLGYFAIGTAWSITKWYFWLTNTKAKILEIQASESSTSYALMTMKHRNLPTSFPPKVGDYKSRIMGWMMLWPASMLWTMINDPVRTIFEQIYTRVGGLMQSISNRIFADVRVGD